MSSLYQRLQDDLQEARPAELQSRTKKFHLSDGNAFVTISFYPDLSGQPYEIFFAYNKEGNAPSERMKAVGLMCNLALRRGAEPEEVALTLIGIKEGQVSFDDGKFYYGPIDAAGKWLLRMSVDDLSCEVCGHDIDNTNHYLACEVTG